MDGARGIGRKRPEGACGHGDTGTWGNIRYPEAERLGGPERGRLVDRLTSGPVGKVSKDAVQRCKSERGSCAKVQM